MSLSTGKTKGCICGGIGKQLCSKQISAVLIYCLEYTLNIQQNQMLQILHMRLGQAKYSAIKPVIKPPLFTHNLPDFTSMQVFQQYVLD